MMSLRPSDGAAVSVWKVERPDEFADLIYVYLFDSDVVLMLTSAEAQMLSMALMMESEIIQRTQDGEFLE
jgi:predicted GTPase